MDANRIKCVLDWQPGCFDRWLRSNESFMRMALYPGESGSRRPRQRLERLAISIRVQRAKGIVGRFHLQSRAVAVHISAWQAMRLPYNGLFRLCRARFQSVQRAFGAVDRSLSGIVKRDVLIGFGRSPGRREQIPFASIGVSSTQ